MMRSQGEKIMRVVAFLVSLILLTACEHTMPEPRAELNFTGSPYRFNVERVDIDEDYVAARRLPHVDHLADISPSQAVRQWVGQMIAAEGKAGRLEINIKDASVVKKSLPKQKQGIEGWLTKEQTEEYDGTLEVEVKLYSPRKILPVARAEAVAHVSHTLREDATLLDRKNMYHQMTVELMQSLQMEMDKNLRLYFANYLM